MPIDRPGALMHAILPRYRLSLNGIHGPAHWLRVFENGKALAALTEGADLQVVEWFAMIHDAARHADGDDPQHGERAATLARDLAARGRLVIDAARLDTLAEACALHEQGRTSSDPTIGCCWDADRLELARLERRPQAYLLSTAAARDPDLQAAAWERGTAWAVDVDLARAWGLNPAALAAKP